MSYIDTVLISTGVFNLLIAIAIYIFSKPIIQHFSPSEWGPEAINLLPLALVASIILPAFTSATCSAIDGAQRADLRAYCNIAGSVIFALTIPYLIPEFGVYGYGISLTIQQLVVGLLSWLTIKSLVPELGCIPKKFSKKALKNTLGFGVMLQINSLASLLSEPLAKFTLANLGGLTAVGYYEIASKLVFQAKGLFIGGIQPMMPAMTDFKKTIGHKNSILINFIKASNIGGIIIYFGLLVFAPFYSLLIFQKIDSNLLILIITLSLGSSINMLSAPLFFVAMSNGIMRWNIASQIVVASCIIFSSVFFGDIYGGNATIIGITLGLIFSALICYIGNANELELMPALQCVNLTLIKTSAALAALTCIVIFCIIFIT